MRVRSQDELSATKSGRSVLYCLIVASMVPPIQTIGAQCLFNYPFRRASRETRLRHRTSRHYRRDLRIPNLDPSRLARGQTALQTHGFWAVLDDVEHRRVHRWHGLHLGAVIQDRCEFLSAFPERWYGSLDFCDRAYFRGLWDLHGRHWSHHATEFSVHSVEFHGGLEEHHRVLPQR